MTPSVDREAAVVVLSEGCPGENGPAVTPSSPLSTLVVRNPSGGIFDLVDLDVLTESEKAFLQAVAAEIDPLIPPGIAVPQTVPAPPRNIAERTLRVYYNDFHRLRKLRVQQSGEVSWRGHPLSVTSILLQGSGRYHTRMRARSALLHLTKLAAFATGKSSDVLLRLTVALLENWRPGRPPRPNPKVVSEEQYNALLESLDQASGKWSRLAALYLRSTLPIGVRISEWPSVEWADDSQEAVRVFTSKRKIDVAPVAPRGAASADRNEDDGYRYIPVDESDRAVIQQQISVVQSVLQQCTAPGEIELAWARYGAEIRQALSRACERISIGRKKPVNVSPTTARAMFRANALQFHSREYVNYWMGHRSLASGRSYGKASQAFKTVKAAAQKLRVTQAENAQRDVRSRERAESNHRQ